MAHGLSAGRWERDNHGAVFNKFFSVQFLELQRPQTLLKFSGAWEIAEMILGLDRRWTMADGLKSY